MFSWGFPSGNRLGNLVGGSTAEVRARFFILEVSGSFLRYTQ